MTGWEWTELRYCVRRMLRTRTKEMERSNFVPEPGCRDVNEMRVNLLKQITEKIA